VRILVTGADGFVGRHLTATLAARGHECRAAVRSRNSPQPGGCVVVGDVGPRTDWGAALAGVDVVVHLAARAHILRESARDPRAEFMRVNAEGTGRLALAAAGAGVRRLIYASTIGVHGNASGSGAFSEHSPLRPHNLYAQSKLAGEVAAAQAAGSALQVAIVRPPLVYGSGVRANFLRILRWVDRGWPLPFAAIRNRRSLVSVWNLADLLLLLCERPLADRSVWLVSDGQDISTAELVRQLARALGRVPRLLPVPLAVLRGLGALSGRSAELEALCGSLAVDMAATRAQLGWSPPLCLSAGLERTARDYLGSKAHAA
jgi:nucleoside-diphosphate-sugar epimerase